MKEIKFLDQGVATFRPTGFQRLIETAATLAVKSTAQSALEYLPLYAAEPQFRYNKPYIADSFGTATEGC